MAARNHYTHAASLLTGTTDRSDDGAAGTLRLSRASRPTQGHAGAEQTAGAVIAADEDALLGLVSAALIAVILMVMEITGLGWCGTRTGSGCELAHFYKHVLGLSLAHREVDFWMFKLPVWRHVVILGSSYPGKEHFATGPVVGFAVRDQPAAVES